MMLWNEIHTHSLDYIRSASIQKPSCTSLNFDISEYEDDLETLRHISQEELLYELRKQGRLQASSGTVQLKWIPWLKIFKAMFSYLYFKTHDEAQVRRIPSFETWNRWWLYRAYPFCSNFVFFSLRIAKFRYFLVFYVDLGHETHEIKNHSYFWDLTCSQT